METVKAVVSVMLPLAVAAPLATVTAGAPVGAPVGVPRAATTVSGPSTTLSVLVATVKVALVEPAGIVTKATLV